MNKQRCEKTNKRNKEVQNKRLRTCEEEEGVFKVWKKIGLSEGGREKRLWVGYVFGGVILN
jgi:predicted DNA-binding antitoxin AbrB/MazE fold protein